MIRSDRSDFNGPETSILSADTLKNKFSGGESFKSKRSQAAGMNQCQMNNQIYEKVEIGRLKIWLTR
jgi:hypothetical protein